MAQPATQGPITESREWKALDQHYQTTRSRHLRELFAGVRGTPTDFHRACGAMLRT